MADMPDCYYLDRVTPGSIELWLSNIAPGHNYNLVLGDHALNIVGYSGEPGNAPEHIWQLSLPAGRYYIQVYHYTGPGSDQP